MNRLEQIREWVDGVLIKQNDQVERRCGYVHLYGVSFFCGLLALKRGLNHEISQIIGMLHDLSSYKDTYTKNHAELSAKQALEYLTHLNVFCQNEVDLIVQAIINHSHKERIDQVYDELIKDADVLQHYLYNPNFTVKEEEKSRLEKLLIELGFQTNTINVLTK